AFLCFFFQAEDGIRDFHVTGVQTCALPISRFTASPITLASVRPRWTPFFRSPRGRESRSPSTAAIFGSVRSATVLSRAGSTRSRSEERRVGKECRSRSSADEHKNNDGVSNQ